MSSNARTRADSSFDERSARSAQYAKGMERLVGAVRELSMARDVDTIRAIVRRVARELTGADGATFVLRDDDRCYYVDEDAIGPLWKGLRFPMTSCISGWSMLHREAVAIEDIYRDDRIPHDAYRPTFVKSLAMVPIRLEAPIGAIGNYWAEPHKASEGELKLLQALADSTSVALENVQVYGELEKRVQQRTSELEAANRELEAFSYSVSHDLRAPLRAVDGFSAALAEDYADKLDDTGRMHLERVRAGAQRMGALIDDLLSLSKITRTPIRDDSLDLSMLAAKVLDDLRAREPDRRVEVEIAPSLLARGDERLVTIALENLLGNAWKFTSKQPVGTIAVGREESDVGTAFFVRDNGAGFDPTRSRGMFAPFQRFHRASEFEGTGIGLATVQRIITRHGGRIWAHSEEGAGATFFFTLTPAT
jgi:signal transduction histidine kinase